MNYTTKDFISATKATAYFTYKFIKGAIAGLLIIAGLFAFGHAVFTYPIWVAACLVVSVFVWVFFVELNYARKEREWKERK